jgi:hypothetical protein
MIEGDRRKNKVATDILDKYTGRWTCEVATGGDHQTASLTHLSVGGVSDFTHHGFYVQAHWGWRRFHCGELLGLDKLAINDIAATAHDPKGRAVSDRNGYHA